MIFSPTLHMKNPDINAQKNIKTTVALTSHKPLPIRNCLVSSSSKTVLCMATLVERVSPAFKMPLSYFLGQGEGVCVPSRVGWTNKARASQGVQLLQPQGGTAVGSKSWRRSAGERAGFLKDGQRQTI